MARGHVFVQPGLLISDPQVLYDVAAGLALLSKARAAQNIPDNAETLALQRSAERLSSEWVPVQVPREVPLLGPDASDGARYVTTSRAAELLGIQVRAVTKACLAGRLRGERGPGGRWLVELAGIEEYRVKRERKAAS